MPTDAYLEQFPPRGPCACCGHPDANHRLLDTIRERHAAGESIQEIARDYRMQDEVVWEVIHGH